MRKSLIALALLAALTACGGVRSDLSARDQELCEIALDEEQSIGYLSEEIDTLIENDGNFSSESDAYAFAEVPVGRSETELSSRIANYNQSDSEGFIDDPELLESARELRDVLFDLSLAVDGGRSLSFETLAGVREAIDELRGVCTG